MQCLDPCRRGWPLVAAMLMLHAVVTARGDSEASATLARIRPAHHPAHHSPTRLRHLRHLGDKTELDFLPPSAAALQSSPARSVSNTVNANGLPKLTVDDNHKPVFTGCANYAPSFKEEEPVGTFVFKVEAFDRDMPEAGGTVTYSFVLAPSDQKKFNIDPHSGIITTKHLFDRDEPIREKVVYLTVRATDNGRPQLDDVCTFKVTIIDINDNPPAFDKVSYLELMPQDLPVSKEVMRISATDIDDGNNSLVYYDLDGFPTYFGIEKKSGVIFLKKLIDKEPGFKFKLNASATDQGEYPNVARINLEIVVVESHKKAPTFIDVQPSFNPIVLKENRIQYDIPVITLDARSNIPDEPELLFVLVSGRTEQTNKLNTFVMESNGTRAYIKQGKALDYETNVDYSLTIRVQNKYTLAAERVIFIKLEDVNDNIPAFTEVISGSVLENEPRGMPVMQVRAIDGDGTEAHNKVTYELADSHDLFKIDAQSGNITTLKEFDREEKDFYNVKVYARDSSPSAIFANGEPNKGEQVFRIEIADKNDNPPRFTQKVYAGLSIAEDANINALVTEVKALDNDTASAVTYSISPDGNIGNAFTVEPATGKIRVLNPLDYETITRYNLTVRAFDGTFEDFAKVEIMIENVNDNRPVFKPYRNNLTIEEEKLVPGCIVRLEATDPDIADPTANQHIQYFVVKEEQRKLLQIDDSGCLSLIKSLDRDPPNGFPIWQVHVGAKDEDGYSPNSLQETTEVVIILEDINDNAPFLNMVQPVVWYENRPPGLVTALAAKDYDSDANGPPFEFALAPSASDEIRQKFDITVAGLHAKVMFDREERKRYLIPVQITDSGQPPQTGTSTLTIEIGDENDNPMKEGASDIFVYNYKGEAPKTQIGRVYVEDPDDWDLPDKTFSFEEQPDIFSLDVNTGMITMAGGTTDSSYLLKFLVTEAPTKWNPEHTVRATVNVTVKIISEEAVAKSGSIRFLGITAEEFVAPGPNGAPSRSAILRTQLALLLNNSIENVDVFTVLHSPYRSNTSLLDVRFSAHGSPYYPPERLNRNVLEHQEELENALNASMLMVNIDECLVEADLCGSESCSNFLKTEREPYAVYTNTTSFVGVHSVVTPLCTCPALNPLVCLNGGTQVGETCECMEGYDGPHCEVLSVGFNGDGWAMYPTLSACSDSRLSLELTVYKDSGLVFYVGPMRKNPLMPVQDFMSLELQDGFPVLMVDYGTGTVRGELRVINLNDQKPHRIDIEFTKTSIEMKVDSCQKSTCLMLKTPEGNNTFLNVNGPLQVGGSAVSLNELGVAMGWSHRPTDVGFYGCIHNMTYNSKTYNLGQPSDEHKADRGCSRLNPFGAAVSFGIDSNFLIAILVCAGILLLLLLAVVVHRRKTDDMYKDMDDIRENIITYEDEGGGEIDAGFDMNVLRLCDGDGQPMLGKPYIKDHLQSHGGAEEVPDICGFLDGKKRVCDGDPEPGPVDDVRHYAYEGDGDTTGSLSSLASGTDEADLDFDYLSDFGPRFRKLADMYGEQPSDEEGDDDEVGSGFAAPRGAESWC